MTKAKKSNKLIEKRELIEKLIVILSPSILIVILTILSFTHLFAGMGLIVISLMFLFPLLFLVQGVYSVVKNANIFLSTGTSVASYLIVLIVYLNETALIYLPSYIVLSFIGYLLTKKYMKKYSPKKGKK